MAISRGFFKKICALLLILLLQGITLNSVLAQEEETEEQEKVPVMSEAEHKQEVFLIQLRKQLQNARNDYFNVGRNIDTAKERLVEVTDTINTLKDQLKNFEYLISNIALLKELNLFKLLFQKKLKKSSLFLSFLIILKS